MNESIKKNNLGPLFVFLSGVTFSLGGVCMKFIPWSPLAINSARNILSATMVGLYILFTGHKLVVNKHVIIGALSIAVTMSLYAIANKLTTAGNAIILQFTVPIWAMLFSVLFLKIKPSRLDIVAAIFVLAGVVCFFIDGISAGNMPGNAVALLSGITYVGVFMMGSFPDSDSLSSTFFGIVLNIIVGLPWLFRTDFASTPSAAWIALVVLGLIQQGCSYIFLNIGLQTTPAVAATLIAAIEPVLNPILVALIYGEVLTPLSLVGAVIVFISILVYNVLKAKMNAKEAL